MTIRHILTHPGGAHKDEFLACCLLAHVHQAAIIRREPTETDLLDPSVCVVDVGGEHLPERSNFDHHQFPKDHPPACSLTLVLQHLDIYEDARLFCEWLEPAEWFDSRGPHETARWLGVERQTLNRLVSPIDITLLRCFAREQEIQKGDTLWEIMNQVGDDLLTYLTQLRQRLTFIEKNAEFWTIETGTGEFHALFMPRTDPLPAEPSMALDRYIELQGKTHPVLAMIYPDRRGPGYGLSRYNDAPQLDFARLTDEPDITFAHIRGFVAKSTTTDPNRLRELLSAAYLHNQTAVAT